MKTTKIKRQSVGCKTKMEILMNAEPLKIRKLSARNIDAIRRNAARCFPENLRASRELYERRFGLGHVMLGAYSGKELVGRVSFVYNKFDQYDRSSFPDDHEAFANSPRLQDYDSAFVYSLSLDPDYRRYTNARLLVTSALDRAANDGCNFAVADGRVAAYNGDPSEGIKPKPLLRAAIDHYLLGGPRPTDRELCLDPLLAFYHRLGGSFHWIMPNFQPEDVAAGGLRIIICKWIRLHRESTGK